MTRHRKAEADHAPDMFELAYLAGFFDGEGCVTLPHHVRNGEKVPTSLRIAVGNVDRRPLDRLVAAFGGRYAQAGRQREAHHMPCYQWTLDSKRAVAALQVMLPFLIVKREQALVGIEYQRRVKNLGVILTDEEKAERREIASRLHALKRVG